MEIAFYVIAVASLVAAFGVVTSSNIVHAALFLLAALLGVAATFVLLYAEFLALVQVLIYGGAVIIVILFALMLTRAAEYQAESETRRWPLAAFVSSALFALMAVVFISDSARYNSGEHEAVPLETLARDLFVEWAVPFEIASLVLLVALVGAVVIGRAGREEDETFPEDEGGEERPRQQGRSQERRRRRRNA